MSKDNDKVNITDLHNKISNAFANCNITLRNPIQLSDTFIMQDGVTNKFLKVEDNQGKNYLIRINGKLWPPFTRKDEANNLYELRKRQIETNVIYSDEKSGFQICKYMDKQDSFSFFQNKKNNETVLLENVSVKIREIHDKCNFDGSYPLGKTIFKAYNRLTNENQCRLSDSYNLALSMLLVMIADCKNHVSSHNDLLPSSVYCENDKVQFVDWEYSSENHRAYDLALFSIKLSLDFIQEKNLLLQYDYKDELDLFYSFSLMKPIVSLLLSLWSLTTKNNIQPLSLLLDRVTTDMQQAITNTSARKIMTETRIGYLHINKYKRNLKSEKKSEPDTSDKLVLFSTSSI